jgi:hypothetical protein
MHGGVVGGRRATHIRITNLGMFILQKRHHLFGFHQGQ